MPWQSFSDIPSSLREREDLQAFTEEQWERFLDVYRAVWESNPELDEREREEKAVAVAIDRAKAVEASSHYDNGWVPRWIKAISTGPLHQQSGRVVNVTRKALEATVDEYRRWQRDLAEVGVDRSPPVTRPVFGPHNDSGRRDGDIEDMIVGGDTLYTAVDWRERAKSDIRAGALDTLSVNIRPRFRDAKTGEVYAPFFKELSPTNHPQDPRAGVAAAFDGVAASHLEEAGFEVETSVAPSSSDEGDTAQSDLATEPSSSFEESSETRTPISVRASEQDMKFAKWLDHMLDRFSTPEGGPGPTRSELTQQMAEGFETSADEVQAVANEERMLPSDGLVAAAAEMFDMSEDDLRNGSFEAPDEGQSEEPGEDEPPEPASSPSANQPPGEPPGGETGGGVAASQGGENDSDEQGGQVESIVASLRERVEELEEQNNTLEEKLGRAQRLSGANTEQSSSTGTGVRASEGEGEGGDPTFGGVQSNDPLEPNTYDVSDAGAAIEAAEDELDEDFTDDEVTVFAMFKDPTQPKNELPSKLESKIRKRE